jgi:hypothetical protein
MDTANKIRSRDLIGSTVPGSRERNKLISNHSFNGKAQAISAINESMYLATSPHTSFGRLALVP